MFIRKVVDSLYNFLSIPAENMSDSENTPTLRKARSSAIQVIGQSDQSAHEESEGDVASII